MSISPEPLKGQVALVTGASSEIGEGVVRYLAEAGAAVVFTTTSILYGGMTLYPGFRTGG